MKVMDFENHFTTPLFQETVRTNPGYPRVDPVKGAGQWEDCWFPPRTAGPNKLADLGEGRLKEMDEAGIDYAHLSLGAPGAEAFELETSKRIARDANDTVAAAVARYPDRFGGFISLAPKDPEGSVKEIDRCVNELGLWGWHTHSNYRDAYLDEKRFWPILKKCEDLDMPIYLHPTIPAIKELRAFGVCLAGCAFGFGVEVSYVFMRMIHRGVFDEFPNLKMILGHFGEGLPFMVNRVDSAYRQGFGHPMPKEIGDYAKVPSYYLKRHMWTTSSGNYEPEALICTRDAMGMDRIIMATDYPFEQMRGGPDMILKDMPNLTEQEKKAYLHDNAKALGFGRAIE